MAEITLDCFKYNWSLTVELIQIIIMLSDLSHCLYMYCIIIWAKCPYLMVLNIGVFQNQYQINTSNLVHSSHNYWTKCVAEYSKLKSQWKKTLPIAQSFALQFLAVICYCIRRFVFQNWETQLWSEVTTLFITRCYALYIRLADTQLYL